MPTAENPFCTRRIRPGAMPYLFPPGESAETLADRLEQNGGWGQIVGPHGSGKSALLAALVPAIEARGKRVARIDLHDGQRRLPPRVLRDGVSGTELLIVVDGYEQLGRISRWRLRRRCRREGWGLLVTSHQAVGLPVLFQTRPDPALAQQVVAQLLAGYDESISPPEVARCFQRHKGNLRETLFDLYDLCQRRQVS